jgi:hypothetical protein
MVVNDWPYFVVALDEERCQSSRRGGFLDQSAFQYVINIAEDDLQILFAGVK